MAKIKIEQPEKRPQDHYPTPEVPGVKPNVNELPFMTAVGLCKKDGQWISYDIKFKGDRIHEINYGEPNVRMIAQMEFKSKSVKLWDELMAQEDKN